MPRRSILAAFLVLVPLLGRFSSVRAQEPADAAAWTIAALERDWVHGESFRWVVRDELMTDGKTRMWRAVNSDDTIDLEAHGLPDDLSRIMIATSFDMPSGEGAGSVLLAQTAMRSTLVATIAAQIAGEDPGVSMMLAAREGIHWTTRRGEAHTAQRTIRPGLVWKYDAMISPLHMDKPTLIVGVSLQRTEPERN